MNRSSSRPSPFKRSLTALVPVPPQAASGANPPAAAAAAAESADAAVAPVPMTHAAPAHQTRSVVPVLAGERVSARRPLPGGPLTFQPLQDDTMQRGKKFFGLHRGLFTAPGRSAAHLLRTTYKPVLIVAAVALLVWGGIAGWQALQNHWSSEAFARAEARDAAIKDGTWEKLSDFARTYGKDVVASDGTITKAMAAAWNTRVDKAVSDAEVAMKSGDSEAITRLGQQLDTLRNDWATLTGAAVPDDMESHVSAQMALLQKEALASLQSGVRIAAMDAESTINGGDVRSGLDAWKRARESYVETARALRLPADKRPALDDTIRQAGVGVVRATQRALQAKLRAEADGALIAVEQNPAALTSFASLRKSLIDEAREYGLSEQDLMDLGRDGDRYTEEISRKVQVRFDQQLQAAGAQATQDLATEGMPRRTAIEAWRGTADKLISDATAVGLAPQSLGRLMDQRMETEAGLLQRVLKDSQSASVQDLKELRPLFDGHKQMQGEIDRLIQSALIQQGNYEGAEEFATGAGRVVSLFGAAMHQYWVEHSPTGAGKKLTSLLGDEDLNTIRAQPELKNLLAIAQAWQQVIAAVGRDRKTVAESLTSVSRITPDRGSATWALEAFSIAWFQMLRDDFSAAALLLQQLPGKLPEGYPLDYISSVANVRAGRSEVTPQMLAPRESISDADRNKLYLLRYYTSVEVGRNAYDGLAMTKLSALIDSNQLVTLAPQISYEAGINFDANEAIYTFGAIRYFYYYERQAGLNRMREANGSIYAKGADGMRQWFEAAFTRDQSDNTRPEERMRRLLALTDYARGENVWPLRLVRALAWYQLAFFHNQMSGIQPASAAFESIAAEKPVLAAYANTKIGHLAMLGGNTADAARALALASQQTPGFTETMRWKAELATGDDRLALMRRAADGSPSCPYALYALADGFANGPTDQYADAYRTWWNTKADELAKREFERPLDGSAPSRESGPDGGGNAPPPAPENSSFHRDAQESDAIRSLDNERPTWGNDADRPLRRELLSDVRTVTR
ncbi:MAG: hypothetical protein AB7K09_00060 [Planctomycetota bacterium]